MRLRRPQWIAAVVIALVPAAALGGWLASPLFISVTVQEEFPLPASAVLPSRVTRAEAQQLMATMAKLDYEMTESIPGAGGSPTKLKQGALHDGDAFHKGSGQATIYRLPDGAHVLRLEDLRVTNGPDLRVILSPHPFPATPADVKSPGYVELGRLKGNIGSQTYAVPPDIDLARQSSVVIYCWPFNVIFSVAPLEVGGS